MFKFKDKDVLGKTKTVNTRIKYIQCLILEKIRSLKDLIKL